MSNRDFRDQTPPPRVRDQEATQAKISGFTGDVCQDCGNFTMVRAGTCLKCVSCGGTTGCS